MATHTWTAIPRVQNDGTGLTLTAGGAAGGGASMVLVMDDAVVISKEQAIRELSLIQEAITRDTWPPSI